MRRIRWLLFTTLLSLLMPWLCRAQTPINGVVTISVTNSAANITVDRTSYYVAVRENAASPTAVFSITLTGSSVAQNFPAGAVFIFNAPNGQPFQKNQTIGTIVATASGPFSFTATESTSAQPSMQAKVGTGGGSASGVASVSGTANQVASTGGATPVLSLPATLKAPGYVAQTTNLIDPRAYGCAADGVTDDTTCFQSAVTYMEANGGAISCPAGVSYLLNRVSLAGNDTILGGSGESTKGCVINVKTDAVFVSPTPASYLAGITIRGIQFYNGSNPIDLALINQSDFEDLEFTNYTGCAIVLVDGERRYIKRITTVHNAGSVGFASLCTGDKTKSLFSASIPGAYEYGVSRTIVDGVWELADSPTFYEQWLWWGSGPTTGTNAGSLDESTVRDIGCFYSCSVGLIQFYDIYNSTIDVLDTDHVANGLSAQPIGFNIFNNLQASRVSSYTPAYNTANQTTQMYVGQLYSGSTIEDCQFSTTANNSTTFGLKLGGHGMGALIGVSGAVYSPAGLGGEDTLNVIGSNISPNGLDASVVLSDINNNGVQVNMMADFSNTAAGTGLFSVKRAPGGNGAFTTDFSSSGTTFALGENLTATGKNLAAQSLTLSSLGASLPTCTDGSKNLITSGCAAFPTPTRAGDVIYWNGSSWASLAGNNSGTNFLEENSSGAPSWAASTGSNAWSSLTNPSGNIALLNTGFSSSWSWGSTNQSQILWDTSGNQTLGLASYTTAVTSSPTLTIAGSYQNAGTPTFAKDSWTLQDIVGTGTNGTSTLTLTRSGSSGTSLVQLPGNLGIGGPSGNGGTLQFGGASVSFCASCVNSGWLAGVNAGFEAQNGSGFMIQNSSGNTPGVTLGRQMEYSRSELLELSILLVVCDWHHLSAPGQHLPVTRDARRQHSLGALRPDRSWLAQ